MELKAPTRTGTLKALSIVAFIIVLIFGVWGLIQAARLVPNVFSSLQSAAVSLSSIFVPSERLEIALSTANVNVEESFDFSWNHENKRADGVYRVSFSCRDGVSMQTADSRGTYQKVFCETPFNLTNATDGVKLIVSSNTNRYVDVPMKLTFTRTSDSQETASTETVITVTNPKIVAGSQSGGATTSPSVPTPGRIIRTAGSETRNVYTVTGGGRASDPNGRVDLSVVILQTGVVDPATNIFTQTSSVRRGGRGAVRFVVDNLGTKTADNWYFNAVVPSLPMYIYTSPMQQTLGPGDKIEFTLGFDQADETATKGVFTVNVDPAGSVNEMNENNNIARAIFQIYQ